MADKNIMSYETVALDEENHALVIIDQTKLPGEVEILHLTEQKDIWQAIYLLQVRGAPAIGVAAGFGLYLAARQIQAEDFDGFYRQLHEAKEYLNSSRPTAVNLSWALNRMEQVALDNRDKPVAEIKELLRRECIAIKDEDVWMCRKIGEYGLSLIKDGDGVLTHCNAGPLATSKLRHGAWLPSIWARRRGCTSRSSADETRPLLQGARLSSFELLADWRGRHRSSATTWPRMVMKNGWVNAGFCGLRPQWRPMATPANKIGTSGVAILAKYYGIPFYVLGPTSTIDMSIEKGEDIPIEQRPASEVTEMWYKQPMAPAGVKVYNPAFDFADHELISGIVTEYGIARPPYTESLKEIFRKKAEAQGKK